MSTQDYSVRIEPHGRTLKVSSDTPVLEAALSAGLNLPHSCKSGHCASCRAQLKQGEIRYPSGRPIGITEQEERAGKVLLCQARPASDLVIEARLIARVSEVEIKTLPCRVARLVALAPDVMQVFLRLPAVESMPFQPGQYLDFLVEDGRRRSFSIASPPHDSELIELHVRKVKGGGFTERLFGHVATGALLRIEGPLGQFVYRPGSNPIVMIAGGTGFAPLKAMLRHILEKGPVPGAAPAQGAAPAREVHLYWGARQPIDVYEEALVLQWTREHPQLKFTAVLSEATAADAPHRRLGWVHEVVLQDYPRLDGLDVYTAGPPALIEAIRASFPQHGLSADRLHFDSFDYAPPVKS